MKKLLTIIVLVTLTTTSLHSQNLFQIQAQYNRSNSILTIDTNVFSLTNPTKVRFNDFNAVLISETNMDSINLKYLKYDLLISQNESFYAKIGLLNKELEKSTLTNGFLQEDNALLKVKTNNQENYINNQSKIHENEIMYWMEKSKGKFKSFLLGTSVGALIITILTIAL